MKQFLFAILSALLFASCGQKENSQVDGGLCYSDIYILVGDELKDAQDYTVNLQTSGSEVDLRVVYPEPNSVYDRLSVHPGNTVSPDIVAKVLDDEETYEKGYYVRTLRISAGKNDSGKQRKSEYVVIAHALDGYAANICVVQAKE